MSAILSSSVRLDLSCYSQAEIPDISLPYFNGIVVIDADYLASSNKIYYGDEIDLKFWSFLGLSMGSDYEPVTIYTLIPRYKYIYIPALSTFTIYDESRNKIFENTNVKSINDLSIDFSVHKSHQFEIHMVPSGYNSSFYRVATWTKHLHTATPKEFNCGVQNITVPDRVRPYLPDDPDNPSWDIKHLANLDWYGFFGNNLFDEPDGGFGVPYDPSNPGTGIGGNPMLPRYVPIDGEGFRRLNTVDWSSLRFENNFYVEAIFKLMANNIGLNAYAKTLDYWNFILPLLSLGLYPLLNDVQLAESIYNNRPVYEPWLIWKIFEFINTNYVDDIFPEFPVPVFDLSPSWA